MKSAFLRFGEEEQRERKRETLTKPVNRNTVLELNVANCYNPTNII